jgi:hypothetical protein
MHQPSTMQLVPSWKGPLHCPFTVGGGVYCHADSGLASSERARERQIAVCRKRSSGSLDPAAAAME